MEALGNLSGFESMLPLLEVVGAGEGGVRKLGGYIKRIPSGSTVAVDGGEGGGEVLSELEEELHTAEDSSGSLLEAWSVCIVPVIRYGSGYVDLDIFQRLNEKYQGGYLLRLGSVDADPDIAEAESQVPLLLSNLQATPGEVDLVLDYAEVDSERTVERVTHSARQAVQWAARRSWRSITLLSGAFPSSISHLGYDRENRIPRLEVDLWRAVVEGVPEEIDLHYGDYTTNHPALQAGAGGWKSHPNLRYARAGEWIVYRKKATLEEGNSSFYDICQAVVENADWEGESFSWADQKIAVGARMREKLGGATQWVALGRSRHLEVVKYRLATLGEP
ncbi:hypothetical protein ACFXKD_12145 [Nocardiopsis aegyptia]|uniref:beta family protein n=1 Tax=Nocardiopsis aegyptia TaxID=220378 RepID=UPI003672E963